MIPLPENCHMQHIYLSRFLGHSKGVLAQCAPFRVLTVQGSLRRPTRHVFKNGPLVPNQKEAMGFSWIVIPVQEGGWSSKLFFP